MKEHIVADGRERLLKGLARSRECGRYRRELLREYRSELRHPFFWRRWLAARRLDRELERWIESRLPSRHASFSTAA